MKPIQGKLISYIIVTKNAVGCCSCENEMFLQETMKIENDYELWAWNDSNLISRVNTVNLESKC